MSYTQNPAEEASQKALTEMFQAIDEHISFRLEAGAGAGKTYSLVKALNYLIENNGNRLLKQNKKIACITYTNIARDEIRARIDNHPSVFCETIHSFSWSVLQGFQKELRNYIPTISEKWQARIEEIGGINNQKVKYDLGYPKATEEEIYLHHNDVIKIMSHFLSLKKFQLLFTNLFPILLIDEYQDTNTQLAAALVSNIIEKQYPILIGLFGDHWQKIYGAASCGLITSPKILEIGKNANFRSKKSIVDVLNKMRPELPQESSDPYSHGEIHIFHTNSWVGIRRTGGHWQGDLPAEEAHDFLERVKLKLKELSWQFIPEDTKILMLTNNVLAQEQNYASIASLFSDPDEYIKKNDPYIEYLIDTIEPACEYYSLKQYGKMYDALGSGAPRFESAKDKTSWRNDFDKLITIRQTGTIGEVIDHLRNTRHPRVSHKIEEMEHKFNELSLLDRIEEEDDKRFFEKMSSLKAISYRELMSLSMYVNDKTPFSTKHGVKGAEFENVLVVCGRGWNQYNWNQMLEWYNAGVPDDKKDAFERSRNLFYVACSRAKTRLCVLFTQFISDSAMQTLTHWFGEDNIHSME